MQGRETNGGAVDVYAGECRIEDGTLSVRHSPLRAINPLVLLVVVLLLVLSGITAVTGWQFGRPGTRIGWIRTAGSQHSSSRSRSETPTGTAC